MKYTLYYTWIFLFRALESKAQFAWWGKVWRMFSSSGTVSAPQTVVWRCETALRVIKGDWFVCCNTLFLFHQAYRYHLSVGTKEKWLWKNMEHMRTYFSSFCKCSPAKLHNQSGRIRPPESNPAASSQPSLGLFWTWVLSRVFSPSMKTLLINGSFKVLSSVPIKVYIL